MAKSMVTLSMTGDRNLKRLLSTMPLKVNKRFGNSALRAAARAGVSAIRSAVSVGPTGNLKRSIAYKNFRTKSRNRVSGMIAPLYRRRGYHQNLYAYGNSRGMRGKGEDWIDDAISGVQNDMANSLLAKYGQLIDKQIAKFTR